MGSKIVILISSHANFLFDDVTKIALWPYEDLSNNNSLGLLKKFNVE